MFLNITGFVVLCVQHDKYQIFAAVGLFDEILIVALLRIDQRGLVKIAGDGAAHGK